MAKRTKQMEEIVDAIYHTIQDDITDISNEEEILKESWIGILLAAEEMKKHNPEDE